MANVNSPRYYHYNSTKGRWIITKNKTYFGSYRTEEEAQVMVENLKEINWDKNQLWKLKYELENKT